MKGLILKAIIILSVTVAITVTDSCTSHHYDERLVYVENCITDSLLYAQKVLKDIDRETLSNPDRHFYDFLSLKIADKRYEKHKSDSLYLTILDYYQRHKKEEIYPEVLYYGGRVYSDLGDYPTALSYFQNALDALGDDYTNLKLRSRIISQTGRLLNQIRLYSEAEKYLKEAIEINRQGNDQVNLVYNLQLLGIINTNLNNLGKAKEIFKEALREGENLDSSFQAKTLMHLAITEDKLNHPQEAVNLIRHTPERVKSITKDWAMRYAAEIYYSAHILDTASMYARQLIANPKSPNHRIAYKILLSPDLINTLPPDSIPHYIQLYEKCTDDYLNRNESTQTSVQISAFNYALKEKEKGKIISRNSHLIYLSLLTTVALIICLVIVFLLKEQNKRKNLELKFAIDNIKILQFALNEKRDGTETDNPSKEKDIVSTSLPTGLQEEESITFINNKYKEDDARNELKETLRNLIKNDLTKEISQSEKIILSESFHTLQEYMRRRKCIPIDNTLWKDLEREVLNVYPNFKKNICFLMNGKETIQDWHTCLLIKLQILPSAMAILLGISPGGVVSRRDSISMKIFQEKLGSKAIDHIIRLL